MPLFLGICIVWRVKWHSGRPPDIREATKRLLSNLNHLFFGLCLHLSSEPRNHITDTQLAASYRLFRAPRLTEIYSDPYDLQTHLSAGHHLHQEFCHTEMFTEFMVSPWLALREQTFSSVNEHQFQSSILSLIPVQCLITVQNTEHHVTAWKNKMSSRLWCLSNAF